jgi:hypothetical protein
MAVGDLGELASGFPALEFGCCSGGVVVGLRRCWLWWFGSWYELLDEASGFCFGICRFGVLAQAVFKSFYEAHTQAV